MLINVLVVTFKGHILAITYYKQTNNYSETEARIFMTQRVNKLQIIFPFTFDWTSEIKYLLTSNWNTSAQTQISTIIRLQTSSEIDEASSQTL